MWFQGGAEIPDRFGPRGVVAIVIPMQNSNMQPEYESMRPRGINNQMYRFYLEGEGDTPRSAAVRVVPDTLGCWPDVVIVGNSIEMRTVSVDDHSVYRGELTQAAAGVRVITAAEACEAALRTLGAKRIGLLNPMSLHHSESAANYYRELGFDVPHVSSLGITKPEYIINVTRDEIESVFSDIARDGVDALLHVGGALGVVDQIADLEEKFGVPIVSVNAATYWFTLRTLGVSDAIPGYGRLFMHADVVPG